MMDISDGLSSEVFIYASSGVGVSIYEDKLPIDQQTFDRARDHHLDPTMCVNGGEDYELVFAIDLITKRSIIQCLRSLATSLLNQMVIT